MIIRTAAPKLAARIDRSPMAAEIHAALEGVLARRRRGESTARPSASVGEFEDRCAARDASTLLGERVSTRRLRSRERGE